MEKETKKSNNIGVIIILAILLIAVLAFGIWAWSKYTTTLTGNSATTVAKWKFGTTTTLTGLDLGKTSGATVFDTVNNVATDRIAPGTKGHFTVTLDTSDTEVALQYVVKLFNIQNKPTNLHFYSDANRQTRIDSTTVVDSTSKTEAVYSGYIAKGDHSATRKIAIYWEWPYETGTGDANAVAANDKLDTDDGKAATLNGVTFDLTITGTQVDPKASAVTTTPDNINDI